MHTILYKLILLFRVLHAHFVDCILKEWALACVCKVYVRWGKTCILCNICAQMQWFCVKQLVMNANTLHYWMKISAKKNDNCRTIIQNRLGDVMRSPRRCDEIA